jgi:hypothetical protein
MKEDVNFQDAYEGLLRLARKVPWNPEAIQQVATYVNATHRTEQQMLMRVIILILKAIVAGGYDARNAKSWEIANEVCVKYGETHLPHI